MYDNDYEEYMRAVLGYPQANDTYYNKSYLSYNNERKVVDENRINKLYPEIYKLLKPMIVKVCENYRAYDIDGGLLETMATEIYNNIESESTVTNEDVKNTRSCAKCNTLLKDLIKILILNQVGNNRPPRPNQLPRPPMFPYSPGPGMPYPPGPPRVF